jgi:RNA polymerase-binding protein DksA
VAKKSKKAKAKPKPGSAKKKSATRSVKAKPKPKARRSAPRAKATSPTKAKKSGPVLKKTRKAGVPIHRSSQAAAAKSDRSLVSKPPAPRIIRPVDEFLDADDLETPVEPEEPEPPAEPEPPLPKTKLTDKQLREFKELLLRKRAELVGDVQRLTDEALNRSRDGYGEHSAMPIHMADVGTDNWEQELTLGLVESERGRVREIDAALERIDNRTYGICLATRQPISVARLQAKPWARYCIEYERLRDEGRAP